MSDQITYNPGAVSDFASDVGSRAGQLHMIYEDTASKTNALQEFFAGHGAQGFFDAQAQMLSGLQGLIDGSAWDYHRPRAGQRDRNRPGHRGLVLKPAVGRVKVGYMRGPRVCPTFCLLLAG